MEKLSQRIATKPVRSTIPVNKLGRHLVLLRTELAIQLKEHEWHLCSDNSSLHCQ